MLIAISLLSIDLLTVKKLTLKLCCIVWQSYNKSQSHKEILNRF